MLVVGADVNKRGPQLCVRERSSARDSLVVSVPDCQPRWSVESYQDRKI